MAKIIAIGNFKGGVSKTTSTINIGAGLHNLGNKVLLIDLDPQYNLTLSLGVKEPISTIYSALSKKEPLTPTIIKPGLDIIPSSLELIKADIELAGQFKREYILTELLKKVKNQYDYILIDCPPSLGLLTINAFVSADLILVPIEAEYLALKGYAILTEALEEIGLQIDKVFITKYDSRKVLNRDVLASITGALGAKAFKTVIRNNIALAEAPAMELDIFAYQPKSNGAEDYKDLAKEVSEL